MEMRTVTIALTLEIPVGHNTVWDADVTGINAFHAALVQPALSGYARELANLPVMDTPDLRERLEANMKARQDILRSARVGDLYLLPRTIQS